MIQVKVSLDDKMYEMIKMVASANHWSISYTIRKIIEKGALQDVNKNRV